MIQLVDFFNSASMLQPIPTGSVTGNIRRAQTGDDLAFEWLWHRYYKSLVRHLRKIASGPGFDPVDHEEVAHSVFIALHHGLSHEKFHSLNRRYQLWKLLTLIGLRKAINLTKRDMLQRQVIAQRSANGRRASDVDPSFDEMRFDEELEHGLSLLDKEHPSQRLRELAIRKMNGHSNSQIADDFGWSRKTVALRLNLIYEIWKEASEA